VRLSVIVPFHRNLTQLERCLTAIQASPLPGTAELAEVIVAADGALEDPGATAEACGASVLRIDGPQGPAVARNIAARTAVGDVLVFVDTDVVARPSALGRLAGHFSQDPQLGAAFGAYDEEPADPGFFSQCRNLAHSFIHQRASRNASTFWAGLGAVRARVFRTVGGFDPRFGRPSVEDIDLGYRIRRAGFRIVLDATAQGTHLKRWTLWSSIVTDVRDRGVPWTQLMHRYGAMGNDLNVTLRYRLAVVVAYVLGACVILAAVQPALLGLAAVLLSILWLIDRPYYQFFATRRGLAFALAWFPFHILHHVCNGLSFALGTGLYAGRRWAGFALPWTLPMAPWSARDTAAEAPVKEWSSAPAPGPGSPSSV
jgi:GT2 family glycosyltransferase